MQWKWKLVPLLLSLRQVWQDFARVEGYQRSGFSYQLRTKSGSVRRELRQHEELAQFEASDDGAAAKSGNVVFVAVSNALDETMHSQAFEMSGPPDVVPRKASTKTPRREARQVCRTDRDSRASRTDDGK
jgi:hypothetical protein